MNDRSPRDVPVLRLEQATKVFRRGAERVVAVADVSFELTPGTLTTVSGPSGSGKTTLLNLLIGWEPLDGGRRTPEHGLTDWAELAIVPQRLGLIDYLTIGENVSLPVRRRSRTQPADDRAPNPTATPTELMEQLGIGHLGERFPDETSLGEQQRAAVARALVAGPAIVVADEPTSHQDDLNTHRVTQLLLTAAELGAAVLVATHDPRVTGHASRRFELVDGRLGS